MALTDYQGLQDSVTEWLVREGDSTFVNRVPDFISLCEANISGRLKVSELEYRRQAAITLEYEFLPEDFAMARTAFIIHPSGARSELVFKTPDDMARMSEYYNSADVPLYYSIISNQIWFMPKPGENSDGSPMIYEIVYYAQVPALTAQASTNAVLTRYPDIYLYGSLATAADYVQDDASKQSYSQRFMAAIDTANEQGREARYANTPAIGMPQ